LVEVVGEAEFDKGLPTPGVNSSAQDHLDSVFVDQEVKLAVIVFHGRISSVITSPFGNRRENPKAQRSIWQATSR
jgi:hypothetical protein